ncbi:DUF397 domain-containing protein [Streptomyces olivoreticuli]|uniref:DUF397 domain-containing protein n=1 Tax=Streptomyces olivoreticuli TaxID=68246 RepID=UPI000E22F8B0|nr:DUF397 domain-containing protein [Streptomyces olivoreticuli]
MSTTLDLSGVEWVKSSFSGNGGDNCLEWAPALAPSGAIPIRDSKSPRIPALIFEPTAWTEFVAELRAAGGHL